MWRPENPSDILARWTFQENHQLRSPILFHQPSDLMLHLSNDASFGLIPFCFLATNTSSSSFLPPSPWVTLHSARFCQPLTPSKSPAFPPLELKPSLEISPITPPRTPLCKSLSLSACHSQHQLFFFFPSQFLPISVFLFCSGLLFNFAWTFRVFAKVYICFKVKKLPSLPGCYRKIIIFMDKLALSPDICKSASLVHVLYLY